MSIPNETVNRNKESLALDLRAESGKQAALKLISKADIFIENFRPGVLAEWGLGYCDLRAVKSDIIYLSISGFGQFGTHHQRAGYDPIAQHYSGWASLNGEPAGGATRAPTFLGDDLAGLHGALGVMAALRHRDQTGEGQHVDAALVDSMLFQSNGLPTAGALGIDVPRTGNRYYIAAPVDTYSCTDGKVFAGVLLDSHWKVLSSELGRDDLKEMLVRERLQKQPIVEQALADYCATRSTAQVIERMTELGLPVTRVNRFTDVAAEEHVASRDMLIETQLSDGTNVPLTGPAVKFSRTPTTVRSAAPAIGAHNEAILRELGYTADQIAALNEPEND